MEKSVRFSVHAVNRMFERSITADDVLDVIAAGQTIEDYPNDTPYPSRLLLGWSGGRPIHVVVAENRKDAELIVVTIYEPDVEKWNDRFSRRML